MNAVTYDLAQILHHVTGWDSEPLAAGALKSSRHDYVTPTYTLDYLLRKMPPWLDGSSSSKRYFLVVAKANDYDDSWCAGYYLFPAGVQLFNMKAETPEDALAALAVKLKRDGILDD